MRPLGRKGTLVSPVGLAGMAVGNIKGPPLEVYRWGLKNGINLALWSPLHKNLTRALLELSVQDRSNLFIVAGMGGGGPRHIRQWMTAKLKLLGLEKFSSFLLGWVHSRYKVRDSVLDELISLREDGLCDNIGLSIHKRRLAYEIYDKGVFDIFMLRYNAAHRGLEEDFFDKLYPDRLPGVITYTATRWTKLLKRPPKWNEDLPRPGDIYRFPLSHPRVNAVWMSPKSLAELKSNLEVISKGPLRPDEDAFIRRFGDAVYASKPRIIGDHFERSARI